MSDLCSESPLRARRCTAAPPCPEVGLFAYGLTAATPLQDVLALVRTTFSSLQRTPDKDIVILGSGQGCPWYGSVELSERAWRTVCSQLTYATVTLKHGMYPLGLEVYTEVIDYIPSERELLERLGEQREKVVPVPKLEIE
jgi:hypothetical protein